MHRPLIAILLAIATVCAAEPARDPFAPAQGGGAAGDAPPDLVLEGMASAGEEVLAIVRVGERRMLIAKGRTFASSRRTLRLVSIGDGEVLLRDQQGADVPLAIAIQPADTHQAVAVPAAPAPAAEQP